MLKTLEKRIEKLSYLDDCYKWNKIILLTLPSLKCILVKVMLFYDIIDLIRVRKGV